MAISASIDCRSEDVRIIPIVITELKFGNIERHIFPAHFVERADHATLENRPEAFDGLSMDYADDVLPPGVVNNAMRIFAVKPIVARILISAKQADFMGDGFANERGESGGIDIRDHARNHIALAADSADDWSFAGANAAGSTAPAALIPMSIFGQSADESFIDFDNSAELINVLHKSDADLVTHGPRCFIRTESHIALNLQRAHALLAGQHEVDDAIPITQRLISILEDCPGNVRKAITGIWGALIALPAPCPVRQFMRILGAAARAANTVWPTAADEICATGIFVREHPFELGDRELMDWFRLFRCHVELPSNDRRIMA